MQIQDKIFIDIKIFAILTETVLMIYHCEIKNLLANEEHNCGLLGDFLFFVSEICYFYVSGKHLKIMLGFT